MCLEYLKRMLSFSFKEKENFSLKFSLRIWFGYQLQLIFKPCCMFCGIEVLEFYFHSLFKFYDFRSLFRNAVFTYLLKLILSLSLILKF